tara:strand:+ start:207 stop:386 length:180 start_codon:yes stop_codon:yes gene_type:complete
MKVEMELSSEEVVEEDAKYKDLEKVFDQEKIALEDIDDVKSSHISDSKSHHSEGIDNFL